MSGITFGIRWIRPTDVRNLGREAIALAASILTFDQKEVGEITDPVRAGFAYNFATESGGAAGSPWQVLARRTKDEREQLGFPREHPILYRTGSYARSWTVRTDARHFERQHRRGQWTGANLVGPAAQVVINVGSLDYRVPVLEGGTEMPAYIHEDTAAAAEKLELPGMEFLSHMEMARGGVPPRPVAFITDLHASWIGEAISRLLTDKAWHLDNIYKTK